MADKRIADILSASGRSLIRITEFALGAQADRVPAIRWALRTRDSILESAAFAKAIGARKKRIRLSLPTDGRGWSVA